jgi:chromosome condensin MukBEF ATPase and DNA-binding subunit MukB
MTFFYIFFQLENVTNKLLEYGILGIILISVAFVAYKMALKINADQEVWRNEAIEGRKDFVHLSQQANENSKALISMRERDVEQNREHHKMIERKLDGFPKEVREELRIELMEQKMHRTSSSGQ